MSVIFNTVLCSAKVNTLYQGRYFWNFEPIKICNVGSTEFVFA